MNEAAISWTNYYLSSATYVGLEFGVRIYRWTDDEGGTWYLLSDVIVGSADRVDVNRVALEGFFYNNNVSWVAAIHTHPVGSPFNQGDRAWVESFRRPLFLATFGYNDLLPGTPVAVLQRLDTPGGTPIDIISTSDQVLLEGLTATQKIGLIFRNLDRAVDNAPRRFTTGGAYILSLPWPNQLVPTIDDGWGWLLPQIELAASRSVENARARGMPRIADYNINTSPVIR